MAAVFCYLPVQLSRIRYHLLLQREKQKNRPLPSRSHYSLAAAQVPEYRRQVIASWSCTGRPRLTKLYVASIVHPCKDLVKMNLLDFTSQPLHLEDGHKQRRYNEVTKRVIRRIIIQQN